MRDWVGAWKDFPIGAMLAVVVIGILVGGGFAIRSVLLPAEERLRRGVYEESKSYRDGTVRDLDNLRLQWLEANPGPDRQAIAEIARWRAADFPDDALPDRIVVWLEEVGR